MDEVEKYQQRLQAIAEKRRLQEEEERAKRQLEDDKLRLQQLKRKSLRDQWLMEGSPLSPNSAVPHPPVWESQPQQIKEHIDKLQTGSSVNRQEKSSDTSHDPSLTNGTAPHPESRNTPPPPPQHGNDISKGVETLLFLGYTEAEPGQGLRDDDDVDDDVVSAVIRAERVMITEEADVTQQMPSEEEEVEEELEEEKEEEKQKGQEEEEEEKEEEKEEDEEEREKESEEGAKEQVEERETGCQEQSAVDGEDHPETWDEELTEERLQNNNPDVASLNQDSSEKVTLHTDEETSADADTHMGGDSGSPLNTDLISDADLAAVSEMETPGGDVQTASGPKSSPASTLNTNGAQKSPGHASATTHTAAPFQDIPLGGAMVEEEPLLATKVEPLTNTTNRNQTEEPRRKTCQCCTIM